MFTSLDGAAKKAVSRPHGSGAQAQEKAPTTFAVGARTSIYLAAPVSGLRRLRLLVGRAHHLVAIDVSIAVLVIHRELLLHLRIGLGFLARDAAVAVLVERVEGRAVVLGLGRMLRQFLCTALLRRRSLILTLRGGDAELHQRSHGSRNH